MTAGYPLKFSIRDLFRFACHRPALPVTVPPICPLVWVLHRQTLRVDTNINTFLRMRVSTQVPGNSPLLFFQLPGRGLHC